MQTLNYNQSHFLKSAALVSQCPDDTGYEIAFCGRSNAGKSSAINTLTQQAHLAKSSKTPGRTQLLNFFQIGDSPYRLVDLPGYGFASVARDIKARWSAQLEAYFQERRSLLGLVLLMDIRHPLQDNDQKMIYWVHSLGLPIHILLTKADKLNKSPALQVLSKVKANLKTLDENSGKLSIQLFSSLKKQGVEDLKIQLNAWFESANT